MMWLRVMAEEKRTYTVTYAQVIEKLSIHIADQI